MVASPQDLAESTTSVTRRPCDLRRLFPTRQARLDIVSRRYAVELNERPTNTRRTTGQSEHAPGFWLLGDNIHILTNEIVDGGHLALAFAVFYLAVNPSLVRSSPDPSMPEQQSAQSSTTISRQSHRLSDLSYCSCATWCNPIGQIPSRKPTAIGAWATWLTTG